MREIIAVFLIVGLCSLSLAAEDIDLIRLDGGQELFLLPKITLSDGRLSVTYPHPTYPIYAENQSITGTFTGKTQRTNSTVTASLTGLDLNQMASSMTRGAMSPSFQPLANGTFSLNSTGQGDFRLPGQKAGLYAVYVLDGEGRPLTASVAMVAEYVMSTEIPDSIVAGQAIELQLALAGRGMGKSLLFGAIMIPEEEYLNASVKFFYNQSLRKMDVSMSNRSLALEDFHLSTGLLMDLLTIMPEDSTLGFLESNQTRETIYLITDPGWRKGSYIVTCAAANKDGTLAGLCQRRILLS